jgi:putative GTP pyrophosphokinase
LLLKVERKNREDSELEVGQQKGSISAENIFSRVTDLAGIRVLHLHISQAENIHKALMSKVDEGEFVLHEDPKAYTWDPESSAFFESLGIRPELKDSYYTPYSTIAP